MDKGVGVWVAVDAEEEEPLALFVVAVVGVKNLSTARDRHTRQTQSISQTLGTRHVQLCAPIAGGGVIKELATAARA